jgi:iron complex outermembrane receptor protein
VATIIAILLAAGAARLAAQAGVIRGRVVRADQPIGLADADLVLGPPGVTTRTDPRGFFEFRGVAPGRVELAVRRVGFAPVVVVLRVDGVRTTQVDIPLQPVATILDPIVTSVTRDQRSLSEVAAAVSVADTSAIGRGRTVGLDETLRMKPGVEVSSPYGTDEVSIGIRGSAARGPQALRGIAVLLDGIPVTESDGRTRLDLIELAASRQVEVVRGPVSALFAGSSGGVVNLVSRSGRDSPGISGGARRGAFGFEKYDGRAGGVFAGGRGSGFAAGSYTSADGYRAHSGGSNSRAQMALDFVAGPSTRVAIEANGSRLDLRLPGSLNQSEFDADPYAAAASAFAFGVRRADTRYRAGIRLEQGLNAGMATGYVFYGGRTLDLPSPFGTVGLNLHRTQGGARFRSDGIAGAPIDATVGFDYDNLFGTDRRWQNVGGVRGGLQDDGYFSVPNLGLYSQAAWQLSGAVGVTLGLRYDRVAYRFESYVAEGVPRQETSFDQLSPRLSALWGVDSATSLYASAGRGTEVPIIGELSASPGAPLRTSLRPKSLWNYEVGARRIIGGRVLLEGAAFYAAVRGEFVPITIDGETVPENASRSRNIGVELGVTARVSPRLELGAGYTFLDLRLQDYTSVVLDSTGALHEMDFSGKLLPAVPRHRVTGEARVRPLAAVDLGMQVEWQSIVYVETSNAVRGTWYFQPGPGAPVEQVAFRAVPARVLLHLNAAWHLGPATLVAGVENLFGLKHTGTVVANEAFGRFYEAGPPASVSLGLRLTGWGPASASSRHADLGQSALGTVPLRPADLGKVRSERHGPGGVRH